MIVQKPISASIQDYLKVIYELTRDGQPVSTQQIADHLQVAPPSVTSMLQRLANYEPPLALYQKHHGVTLTAAGREAALRTIRRHRLLELFLVNMLGYSWDEVHDEAEAMEHTVSARFEDRLARVLGEPEFDPHGDPIPGRDLNLPDTRLVSLDQLAAGQQGVVRRVRSSDSGLLRYLEGQGLRLGAGVEMNAVISYDRTVHLRLRGAQPECVIGLDLAQLIEVEIMPG